MEYYRTNELYHHGILGQKWGVRRYQNKDGTYTEEGKVRRRDIDSDVESIVKQNPERVKSIISSGEELANMANELGNDYTKAFSSLKVTDKIKNSLLDSMHEDFGNGVDDDELFKWVLEEKIVSNLDSLLPASVKSARNKYEKVQDTYWNDVEDFSKDLVNRYNGTKVVDANSSNPYINDGERIAKSLLYKSLETDWPSYLMRHFDDYWVYDTPEYYSMVDRISKEVTMDEYNKRFG